MTSEPKLKQYLVWDDQSIGDEVYGYWLMFDTLKDAVSEACGREIFVMKARRLGRFKNVEKIIRIKDRKKRKKKL